MGSNKSGVPSAFFGGRHPQAPRRITLAVPRLRRSRRPAVSSEKKRWASPVQKEADKPNPARVKPMTVARTCGPKLRATPPAAELRATDEPMPVKHMPKAKSATTIEEVVEGAS